MQRMLALTMLVLLAACSRSASPVEPMRPTTQPGRNSSGLIDQPIDSGTGARIQRTAADLGQCVAALEEARINFVPSPDRMNSETCGLRQAGVLGPDMGTIARLNPAAPTLSCETALGLSVWRRQSLEPAAREILGSDVVQIDHFGTYACRGINGRAGARPSAHSMAAAIDIGGFRLRDGRRVTVAADWSGEDAEARFLRRIRDEACKVFGTTLSPDYNAEHRDHLHMEPAGRFCA